MPRRRRRMQHLLRSKILEQPAFRRRPLQVQLLTGVVFTASPPQALPRGPWMKQHRARPPPPFVA
eukprot:6198852-Pleurochrysis_carterae.AAC.1